MPRATAAVTLAAVLLAGCSTMTRRQIEAAGTPALLETARQQALASRWTPLALFSRPQPEIIDELARRGAITPREAAAVRDGEPFPGMSADAVELLYGPPHRISHIAVSSGAETYHYSAPGGRSIDVFLRGGRVVSWSDL